MKKYRFEPDYHNIVDAAWNKSASRLPLYEHIVCGERMADVIGFDPYLRMNGADRRERIAGYKGFWEFWRTMGYDTASFECCITPILPGGGALGSHVKGVIQDQQDFEAYPWHKLADLYFDRFSESFELLAETCPEGMKAVGGVGNGLFECVQDVTGYMDLCYMRTDDPELYKDLFRKMGDVIVEIWTRFLKSYSDAYCVLRFGDDLGFKSNTLLSAEDIRELVLPQYRRVTDLVHKTERPFLLHSCGNLFGVFDDIIRMANIDAKHSNEDQIAHFAVWAERYGSRIGNFGGIDTDVLCRRTPEEIRAYVFDSLERVKDKGGIAFASGNSIPHYVPLSGYLAMVEAVRDRRGDTAL